MMGGASGAHHWLVTYKLFYSAYDGVDTKTERSIEQKAAVVLMEETETVTQTMIDLTL